MSSLAAGSYPVEHSLIEAVCKDITNNEPKAMQDQGVSSLHLNRRGVSRTSIPRKNYSMIADLPSKYQPNSPRKLDIAHRQSDMSPKSNHNDSGFVCSPEDSGKSDAENSSLGAVSNQIYQVIEDIPIDESDSEEVFTTSASYRQPAQNAPRQKRLITLSVSDEDEVKNQASLRSSLACSCSDSSISMVCAATQTDSIPPPPPSTLHLPDCRPRANVSPCTCGDCSALRSNPHTPLSPTSMRPPVVLLGTRVMQKLRSPASDQGYQTSSTVASVRSPDSGDYYLHPQFAYIDSTEVNTRRESFSNTSYPGQDPRFSFLSTTTTNDSTYHSTLESTNRQSMSTYSNPTNSPRVTRKISRYAYNIDPSILSQNQYTNEMAVRYSPEEVAPTRKKLGLDLNKNFSQSALQHNPYCSPMVARRYLSTQQSPSLQKNNYGSLDDIKEIQENEEVQRLKKDPKTWKLRNLSQTGKSIRSKWQTVKRVLSRGSSFRRSGRTRPALNSQK